MAARDAAVQRALGMVDAQRVAELTLDLVRIRSYTGETVAAAEFYADHLSKLGLEVQVLRDFPRTPQVVARLRGTGRGPTLELNGHLDTVPIEHSEPRIADGAVFGRGAADMKGGLAAEVEAVRCLMEAGVRLRGDLLLTAHGLHEAPTGHGEDLSARMRRGPKGNAAIIAEGASDALLIAGLGMGIFEITISRPGQAIHENSAPPGTPHPILAANRLVTLIQERAAELARVALPYLGAESFFIGVFQSGDFYNRLPVSCRIVGTRRYAPEKSFDEVKAELEGLARRVEAETGAGVRVDFTKTRDGFRLAEDAAIVAALRAAYAEVAGRELPLQGWRSVADAPIFEKEGGVPAVYHSPGGEGAHADLESVRIADLVRAARVYLLTAVNFAG